MKIKYGKEYLKSVTFATRLTSNEEIPYRIDWTLDKDEAQVFTEIDQVLILIKEFLLTARESEDKDQIEIEYDFSKKVSEKIISRVEYNIPKAVKQIYLAGYDNLAELARIIGFEKRSDLNNFALRFNSKKQTSSMPVELWNAVVELIPNLDKAIIKFIYKKL